MKESVQRVSLVTLMTLAFCVFTACSDANRESDENVGTTPPPEAEVMEAAGEEPEPEGPEGVEPEEPEAEEEVEPTVSEVAEAVGGMGEEPAKEDEGGGPAEAAPSEEYVGARETWDERMGNARVILTYDEASDAFVGTVQNVTRGGLCGVTVEVHLSTGAELGPTPAADLPANRTMDVTLPVGGESFEGWNVHLEGAGCD